MEASRITLDPATQKPLTKKRRQELRRERVLGYIRSKPAGERIKLPEIMQLLNIKNFGSADSLIRSMLRQGLIRRHEIGLRAYAYSIPGDANTVTPPRESEPKSEPTPQTAESVVSELEQCAMRYSWHNPEQHDSLRGFIRWMREAR
jgi:hypothetical protein